MTIQTFLSSTRCSNLEVIDCGRVDYGWTEANETIFNNWSEFIRREVERIISLNLEHKPYDSLKSKEQIQTISQQVIEKLTNTNKNFRYIVNVTLIAKGGNGLDIGGLSYWNGEMDGSTTVKWESKYLTCIATVYGIAN